jgi:hypothetical protein
MKNAQDLTHEISRLIDGQNGIKALPSSKGSLDICSRIITVDGDPYVLTIQGFKK